MENLLKIKELQETMGISRSSIYRMLDEGMPCHKMGNQKKGFYVSEVKQFIDARKRGVVFYALNQELNNIQLAKDFKCGLFGTVRVSHSAKVIVLISDYSNSLAPTKDYVLEDTLHFSGISICDEQDFGEKGFVNLITGQTLDYTIQWFEKISEDTYVYRGVVEIVGRETGTDHTVYFKCRIKENYISLKALESVYNTHNIKALPIDTVYSLALATQSKVSVRTCAEAETIVSPYVERYILEKANGKCELCKQSAPFNRPDGTPYLIYYQVHNPLLQPPSTLHHGVALCPNCQAHMIHIVPDIEMSYLVDYLTTRTKTR